jgi:hypothetical protein
VKGGVRGARPARLVARWAVVVSLLPACRGGAANDLPDAGVSPQAKAEPAELENVVASSAQPFTLDAGPPPVPLRSDEQAPADTNAKDGTGWTMDAILRTSEMPPAFRGPETAISAIDGAKKKLEPHLTIDFTASRARIVLASGGFVLPEGSELRARSDRYGHFVLLPALPAAPAAREYRIAAPGSLRALLGERRIDVEPLVVPAVIERGEGARRLGYRTRRVEVANRAATATFELARFPESGEGGVLLCRALLDLMNAPPSTPACGPDEVPLHVEWHWAGRGALTFEATSAPTHAELVGTEMAAPPAGASFVQPSLPEVRSELLVEASDVAAFRTAPADVPGSSPDASAPHGPPGLSLANAGDQLRLAWLDGVPIAWLAAGGRITLPSVVRGRYGFAWRTFLGDAYDAPITITVPGTMTAGSPDAGAL